MDDKLPGSRSRAGELPRVGEILEGKYVLQERVASGGMGVIVKAEHQKLERDVAVKLLHPRLVSDEKTVKRFEREIDLAKRLSHPNIVQLLDYGRTEAGVLFIVMEHLEGEDLHDLVDREGPLAYERTTEIILQVLDGLAEAHDADLIHRDLKPSNVFLTKRRRGGEHAKLLDFGVAKSLSAGDSSLTQTGSACGTAMYMPPETLFDASASKCIDVYAVGLMMLEMMLGERVFDAGSLPQTLMLHVTEPIRMPKDIAETPVGEVLERATAKHPEHRYADAVAMLEALGDAVDQMPTGFEYDPSSVVPVGSKVDKIELGTPSDLVDANLDQLKGTDPEESTEQIPAAAPPETPSPEAHPAGDSDASATQDLSEPAAEESFEESDTEVMQTPHGDRTGEDEAEAGSGTRLDESLSSISTLGFWALGGGTIFAAAVVVVSVIGGSADEPAESGRAVAGTQNSEEKPVDEPPPADDESETAALEFEPGSTLPDAGSTAPKTIEVEISSEPSGAAVYRGGERLGTTPDTFRLARPEAGDIDLKIRRSGFSTSTISVDPTSERSSYSTTLRSNARPEPPSSDEGSAPAREAKKISETRSPDRPTQTDSAPDRESAGSPPSSSERGPSDDDGTKSSSSDSESSENAFESIADDYEMD